MASVSVRGLTVTYNNGKTVAADGVDLSVKDGELFVLLGPSGCGKTTVLHSIAGLIEPSDGEIKIGDDVVTSVKKRVHMAPQNRKIAMVFQEYALYPNMTVRGNLSFPLENLGMDKDKIEEKVRKTSKLMGIEDLLGRKPAELSGGQRQRVALGRAIIRNPSVFLLDEPLGNLDAKLRLRMRFEIKKLQRELGVTTVHVTHDQTEAMTMADRIMIMKDGKVVQVGTPEDLFLRPDNLFVAGFIGTPSMNLIDCTLVKDGGFQFDAGNFTISVPPKIMSKLKGYVGKKVVIGIRPSDILECNSSSKYSVKGKIEGVEPMGDSVLVHIIIGGLKITAKLDTTKKKQGDDVVFGVDPAKLYVFDKRSEKVVVSEGG